MPTIADVARIAGVSVSTVSYALSGKRPVAEETRQRILDVIRELDYHPNVVASGLARQRSNTIGVMYPTEMNVFSERQLELVLSITHTATLRGRSLMLWSSALKAEEVWKLIRQHMLDGVLLTEIKWHDPRVELLKAKNFPFVMIGRCADTSGINYVDVDFRETLRGCVNHLADLGHKRIAFFNTTPELIKQGYSVSIFSQEGFEQAIAERGLEGQIVVCQAIASHAYQVTQDLLKQKPRVTGIIFILDPIVPGVLQAVRDAGLSVPEDISLVSNFNQRSAMLFNPPLTGQDFIAGEDLGVIAMEILLDLLDGCAGGPIQTLFAPHLAVRQSSGPLRSSASNYV